MESESHFKNFAALLLFKISLKQLNFKRKYEKENDDKKKPEGHTKNVKAFKSVFEIQLNLATAASLIWD